MTEKTIAKFKYGKDTYKLLELTIEDIGTDGIPTCLTTIKYIILKNRKRLCTTKWLNTGKQKFANIILSELLQSKMCF